MNARFSPKIPLSTEIPLASGELPAGLSTGDRLDVLVVGAGGAGLSAAVFATVAGLSTAIVERSSVVGGTTAFTAGTTWVPGTRHAADVGADDSRDDVSRFLDAAVGPHAPRALRDAFIDLGPEAVAVMERGSSIVYRARQIHPDYLTQLPGARLAGRALEPHPFDGRALGERLALVRPPTPEFTVFGGMSLERDDIGHLLGAHPTDESRAHLLALRRAYRDAVREHGRDTRRTMGNALVAGLLHTLDERAAPVLTRSEVRAVVRDDDGFRVTIAVGIDDPETVGSGEIANAAAAGADPELITITARQVVFATGGFNRHPERRADLLPGHPDEWCPGAPGHTGQAHDLLDGLGGRYGRRAFSHVYYAPVSRRRRADGSWAVFPHFVMDRAKPRMVVVDQHGHRYVNEATSYHLFGAEMVMHDHEDPGTATPSYLITDAEGMRRYGLGVVHPFARQRTLDGFVDEGYLLRADTIAGLAGQLGVPQQALERTVLRANEMAAAGEDPDFHRGSNAYQRFNGDSDAESGHPNLGPIASAPYFAVRLYPGDIGAATGYVTDAAAAVLDASGERIDGIYAVGNDMQSVMGGTYPAPGITIGPGLVFAYAAIRDIAGAPLPGADTVEPLPGWDAR